MPKEKGPHVIHRLTDRFCRTAPPGLHNDGGTLYLFVQDTGARSWVQRLNIDGKPRKLGLGSYALVSLKEARQKALENRKLARAGGDPLTLKRRPSVPTFEEAVETVIAIHRDGWKNTSKTEKLWRSTLQDYATPRLGRKRVDQITTADVMAVLVENWHSKNETMQKVRQRIGAVMKWAVAQGYREDNPAGEAISAALPRPKTVKQHRRALPFAEVAAAMDRVRRSGAWKGTKLAFEFLVLTACRSGEVREATWEEVNFQDAVWTVSAARMKMRRDHRVPLSDKAQSILVAAREITDASGLIFPSKTGRALSDNTLSKLLRELGIPAVPHGFRSSFRDWAAECTSFPGEIAELALAHVNNDRTEAAYRRTDYFEKRRQMMDAWVSYLTGESGKVVSFPTV